MEELLGVRCAVVGKGGSGKTTLIGTLARVLGQSGRRVLAADLDACPGLAGSLGMKNVDDGLPADAVEEHSGSPYGWRLASGLNAAQAVERYSVPAPDGVRYLTPGKLVTSNEVVRRNLTAVRQILKDFCPPDWDVVADLSAGPSAPYEGYHRFADRVLMVVTPAWSSYITAVRLQPLIAPLPVTVVASMFTEQADHAGLTSTVRLPFDPRVREADRLGKALIDYAPESEVVTAIRELAARLIETEDAR